jgi:hypothetical protein
VGLTLAIVGATAHTYLTVHLTSKALAYHEAEAGIHAPPGLEQRLEDLEDKLEDNQESWQEQRTVNKEVLRSLGQIEGYIKSQPRGE